LRRAVLHEKFGHFPVVVSAVAARFPQMPDQQAVGRRLKHQVPGVVVGRRRPARTAKEGALHDGHIGLPRGANHTRIRDAAGSTLPSGSDGPLVFGQFQGCNAFRCDHPALTAADGKAETGQRLGVGDVDPGDGFSGLLGGEIVERVQLAG